MYAYAASEAQIVAQDLLSKINEAILFPLITLLMAIALLVFLYGAFEYVKGAASDADRETGKRHLLYGTIGMLVMLSAYTILSIAAATFDLDDELKSVSDTGFFGSEASGRLNNSFTIDRSPSYSGTSGTDSYTSTGNDRVEIPVQEEGTVSGVDTLNVAAALPEEKALFYARCFEGDARQAILEATVGIVSCNLNDNMFEGELASYTYEFYKDDINAAIGDKTIAYEEIAGWFSIPVEVLPSSYSRFENMLGEFCTATGGNTVFSISINNDTSRAFFCADDFVPF